MLADILTVMWKERKSLLRVQGGRPKMLLTFLTPVILAIYMPWEAGRAWVEGPISLLPALAIPILFIAITVPEAFAGERERHTLETLLASRLPDRAILLGKVGLSVAVGWGATLLVLLVGLFVANLVHGDEGFLMYTPIVATATTVLSLLISVLTASLGVFISLRVGTVQEASHLLFAALLLPPTVMGPVALFLLRGRLRSGFSGISAEAMLAIAATILALAGFTFLAIAIVRFRRARLILR